ncbi:Rv3654c family TadE-like protein [Microbacterium sp. AZCO]|uniref:Rv3654c family TadE-like protein n=1 Tax=Microbacterium sp. AZCO TaxID=3142976 RepID=UPI0031F34A15
MPGSALAAGIVACAAALVVACGAATGAAVASQRLAGAADAAALAAADAASGAVQGVPCERASEVAAASGARVVACEVDELIATVSVSTGFGRLVAAATARAGPPP